PNTHGAHDVGVDVRFSATGSLAGGAHANPDATRSRDSGRTSDATSVFHVDIIIQMEQTVITYSKKICLLGEFAVGKTSLVRRFVYNLFDDRYISTIGVRVSRKTVAVPVETQVAELTMMVWDLAGSEEFNRVSMSYLRGAAGAVLVYDLTRAHTFDE